MSSPTSPGTSSPRRPSSAIGRPSSTIARPARSSSRMSLSSKQAPSMLSNGSAAASRLSDEDGVKTSVKVAVRVRPSLRPSDAGYDSIPQRFQRSMVQVTSPTSIAIDSLQGKKLFVFDKVFGPEEDQDGVWEYLGESVNAFLQGYNVSLLAYGQSGAGKSYTMGTCDPSEQQDLRLMGVIPRAAAELFNKLSPSSRVPSTNMKAPIRYSTPVNTMHSQNNNDKQWSMKATYVEIYNEQLRDLLLPDTTLPADRPQVSIREDTKGRMLLTGLHEINVNSVHDLLSALNFGSSIRQTDSTAINAKSSRSHAVFTVYLVRRKQRVFGKDNLDKRYSAPIEMYSQAESTVTVESKFHFVDLAGSERLKNTGAQGDRAKEGISINAGLASLGKVISQLSSRSANNHVSYRDSKLTRLLQDSLGGNAVTYMVACVTPVEFHLSETLNTVQYAQRARAIQSKPQIQEIDVESDTKALVERLRAEITFLREQVRTSDRSNDRNGKLLPDRAERTNDNEVDLQNQLLDLQENYSALSQRHAKLISEITKARDAEIDPRPSRDMTNSSVEALARSNSFAEAVEQVVLEYEKTIQSLEISLSSTRSTLASNESSLMEYETKIAYMDTINAQLQARLQKTMDKESNTDTYLKELESRLDGHNSGEERHFAVLAELRKELQRVRENEAGCEEYISTLEERLAESDQDLETMQREMNKLQTIIERQRHLGKLDNLLHDLDHLAHGNGQSADFSHYHEPTDGDSNGFVHRERGEYQALSENADDLPIQQFESEPNDTNDASENGPAARVKKTILGGSAYSAVSVNDGHVSLAETLTGSNSKENLALNNLSDKLEDVTQELFDVKLEHESTVNDLADMTVRYEDLLREFHRLQNEIGPRDVHQSTGTIASPTFTTSVPIDNHIQARLFEEHKDPLAIQTLSSELLSTGAGAGFSSTRGSLLNRDSHLTSATSYTSQIDTASILEKDESLKRLQEAHEALLEEHQSTLNLVEELKAGISRSRINGIISPTNVQVLRRKSSQNLMSLDRANRSFKGLKNIAAQYLDGNENAMEVFELNLNGVLHELQTRSDRILELENEVSGLRKDMEVKVAMITGLARERSSINNSPLDISVVAQLQSRLAQNESDLQTLHEKTIAREQELIREVRQLKESLSKQDRSLSEATSRQITKQSENQNSSDKTLVHEKDEFPQHKIEVVNLKTELGRHKALTEDQTVLITDLEQSLTSAKNKLQLVEKDMDIAKQELSKQLDANSELETILLEHQATIKKQSDTVTELRDLHLVMQKDLDSFTKKESKHTEMIDELEQQLATTYDQHQDTGRRLELVSAELEALRKDRETIIEESQIANKEQKHLVESLTAEINALQVKLASDAHAEVPTITIGGSRAQRSNSVTSMNLRKSASTASLPSPPPAIPLPPLPSPATPPNASHMSTSYNSMTPVVSRRPSKDYVATHFEDQEARIKTLEKQLQAEKALTATLEEALTDCEKTMKKLSLDRESFQNKANQAQQELDRTRNESQNSRYSMQAMEDERLARLKAEKAKKDLEERMQALSNKKKSRNFACF